MRSRIREDKEIDLILLQFITKKMNLFHNPKPNNALSIVLVTTLLSNAAVREVECTRTDDMIRPGRYPDVDRFDEVYLIVRNTFLLAIAPAVISFLYGVLRDPDLPFIAKTIWRAMKKKLLGTLSRKTTCNTNKDYKYS